MKRISNIKVCLNDYIDAQKALRTVIQEVEHRKAKQGEQDPDHSGHSEGNVSAPERMRLKRYFETLNKLHERELFN